jgi:CTP synthase (UTP-ammonia lyase)
MPFGYNLRMSPVRIGVIGDFRPYVYHQATNDALEWTAKRLGIDLDYEWVPTDALPGRAAGLLAPFDGIWASPGSPYASFDGALEGIRFARESGRPFVAT